MELLTLSHRGLTPTGVDRCGDCRSADLGSVSLQTLCFLREATSERACSSNWNRPVRTRLPGGVGRAVSNDRPYPITPGTACVLWGASPLYENGGLAD